MNKRLWLFPLLSIALNILVVVIFAEQMYGAFDIIWLLTAFVPLIGITLTIYYHKKLHVPNMIILIFINLIMLIPFVFWCFVLMLGMGFGGMMAAGAWDKYSSYFLIALAIYGVFMIGCIIRSHTNKHENINVGNEDSNVTEKAQSIGRKKQGIATIAIIACIVLVFYGLGKIVPSISNASAGLDLYATEFQPGEEVTAYTKTNIAQNRGAYAFRTESEEPLNSLSKPVYTITVSKATMLDDKEKLAYNLSKESGKLIVIDIGILLLADDYIWDSNSFRVRDNNNNWLDVVKRTENFSNTLNHKLDNQKIILAIDNDTEYVDFLFYTDKWNSSNSATAKIHLDISN